MQKLFLVTISVLLLATSIGCKLKQDGGQLQGVDDPREMPGHEYYNSEEIMKKKLVFIYYANDTYAPKFDDFYENLELLQSVLNTGGERLLEESENAEAADRERKHKEGTALINIAKRLRDDFNNFREVVISETESLKRFVCDYRFREMSLAIFRNSKNDGHVSLDSYGTRQFKWEYCSYEDEGKVVEATMRVRDFEDFRLRAQPLSDAEVFHEALAAVQKQFPPKTHRYILVTKAHGSKDMAIMPHLSADMKQLLDKFRNTITPEQITAREPSTTTVAIERMKETLAKESLGKTLISDIGNEAKELMANLGDDKVMMPILGLSDVNRALEKRTWNRVGVLKQDYFKKISMFTYGDPQQYGMYFPVVFMESCKSKLTFDENLAKLLKVESADGSISYDYKKLPVKNVGLLYTSDEKGLGYSTVDYGFLFEDWEMRQISDFQKAMTTYMDKLATRK